MRTGPEIEANRDGNDASGGGFPGRPDHAAGAKVWMIRFAGLYAIWLALNGWKPLNAVIGIPAALLATWAGVVLLPPAGRRLKPLRAARFAAGFLWQSVAAGLDVAWRVFQVRMPLQPGIVRVPASLPEGSRRSLFCGLASLQPGSLACGTDETGDLLFHCLDTREDMASALSRTQEEVANLWEDKG